MNADAGEAMRTAAAHATNILLFQFIFQFSCQAGGVIHPATVKVAAFARLTSADPTNADVRFTT